MAKDNTPANAIVANAIVANAALTSILQDYDGDALYALDECLENASEARLDLQDARQDLKKARAFMQWQMETYGSVSPAFKDSLGDCIKQCNRLEALANSEGYKANLLAGLHYIELANDAMHKRYCRAIAVSVGKESMPSLLRWLNTQYALLHKLATADSVHKQVQAGKCSSEGAATLLAMRRAELAHLEIVEARATIKECREIDAALWQWVNAARKEGANVSNALCQLGQSESLKALYGHAYVMHASVGSVATSKREREKAKAFYAHDAHPYADHDATIAQAYVHDETGARMLAPFPQRPVISRKHCRKRAALAPIVTITS